MISTVIVSYKTDLEDCLESVVQSDEIVIIDLGDTIIPKGINVKVFTHKKVDYVEQVRNFAVSKTKGDWILVLDPDERMTKSLWEKLIEVKEKNKYVAVNIPRKNIFFGKWITHTNWWPDRHVRFFQKDKVKWTNEIHAYPEVLGETFKLPAKEDFAILHFGYQSIEDFISRQSRYSTVKAQHLFEGGVRFSWVNFFWNPIREFLVRYIRHLGFLDGFYGLALTYLMMIYQLEVAIKLWELEKKT